MKKIRINIIYPANEEHFPKGHAKDQSLNLDFFISTNDEKEATSDQMVKSLIAPFIRPGATYKVVHVKDVEIKPKKILSHEIKKIGNKKFEVRETKIKKTKRKGPSNYE